MVPVLRPQYARYQVALDMRRLYRCNCGGETCLGDGNRSDVESVVLTLKAVLEDLKMRSTKVFHLILGSLFILTIIGCGGGLSEYAYPKEVVDNYMTGCTATGEAAGWSKKDRTGFWKCSMKELEREYSLVEFKQISEDMLQRGFQSMPAKMNEIGEACLLALE